MKKDVLYMTDLDGTFLTSDKKVSDYSVATINELIKDGLQFSVATARTPATIVDLLKEIDLKLPIVTMNGASTYDIKNEKYINVHHIEQTVAQAISEVIKASGESAFTYCIHNHHIYAYYNKLTSEEEAIFVDERDDSPRKTFVKGDIPQDMQVVYFVMMNTKEVIEDVYEKIVKIDGISAHPYEDVYHKGLYYLEIYKEGVSKAAAIEALKEEYHFNKLICFGDNLNDLPMFEIADEAYAVANAKEEVKEVSKGVIGHHNEDGVANFLKKSYKKI